MAAWGGMARTNYFRVKDEAVFRIWAEELELVVINLTWLPSWLRI